LALYSFFTLDARWPRVDKGWGGEAWHAILAEDYFSTANNTHFENTMEGVEMSKPRGILIFGANGSGKTTLGRELARILNFKHIDHEDYAFEKSEIPYTVERSYEKCKELMLADIKKSCGFVLSAVTGDFGQDIESLYGLAVHIEAPLELRIERVKQRNIDKFGDRASEGGDMAESLKRFVDFVAKRPLPRIRDWEKTVACPVIRVDGTADYKQTAADIADRFYTKSGEPWRVYTAALGDLKIYRFTIIFARYDGAWLYARHKDRDTFETAGGHIEPGETPLDCAKRELYEETGAAAFSIFPAFDYAVHTETEFAYGQVFYADVQTLGELPESEMAEVRVFTTIPDKLTYPMISPVLYDEMDKWIGRDKVIEEYWAR
jgi:energy-coupling factor transporter ATP-binding protein EcfA2